MALEAIIARAAVGLFIWAGNKWLVDHTGDDGRPKSMDQRKKMLRMPAVGVGTVMPLVYGDVFVENPPWLEYMNDRAFSETETAGSYRYADMIFGIGIPPSDAWGNWRADNPPRLLAIWVQGQRIALGAFGNGITHGQTWNVDQDLGGRGRGGFFRATIEFFDGRADQDIVTGTRIGRAMFLRDTGFALDPSVLPGYIESKPGYRHQMVAAITMTPGIMTDDGVLFGSLGEVGNLVSISFEVQAYGSEPILVDGETYEANPACVLYDLLCGQVYKAGVSPALVDKTSFQAVADLLSSEGHGMSAAFNRRRPAQELLVEINDQANLVLIEDHATGKLKLKAIRDDYDPNDIPLLTKHNILNNASGEPDLQIDFITWSDVQNELRVEFTDRKEQWRANHGIAQRGAVATQQSGRIRSTTVQYPCITSQALAAQLAARELAIVSRPLMAATCRVNRTLYAVQVGDAVRMQYAGIVEDKAFRVVDVDHGQLADGSIRLTLVEDVFGQVLGAYPPWGNHPPFEIPDLELDPG